MTLSSWIFESFLLIVLMITLFYIYKVDRALNLIRIDSDAMKDSFVKSVVNLDLVQDGIENLKIYTNETEKNLSALHIKSEEAGQYLEALLFRADEASQRLSHKITRPPVSSQVAQPSKAERELIKALNLG